MKSRSQDCKAEILTNKNNWHLLARSFSKTFLKLHDEFSSFVYKFIRRRLNKMFTQIIRLHQVYAITN